jgi:transcriptional regulator with XRE-family HTH domain
MSEFYTELKALRKQQGINLEEIHNRTKINLSYLEAIEEGRFDLLPHTYIRLFIRAYATEIGANPNEIVNKLENFLENRTSAPKPKKDEHLKEVEKTQSSDKDKAPIFHNGNVRNVRTETLKGIILVGILIFSIYIIRVINKEEATKIPLEYPSEFIEEGSITDQDLQNNFDILSEQIQELKSEPPYIFKLAAAERVWYRTKTDTLKPIENLIPSGDNRLYEFGQTFEILLKHTRGINLYLNGIILNSINSSSNPVRVTLSVADNTVTIQQFVPNS